MAYYNQNVYTFFYPANWPILLPSAPSGNYLKMSIWPYSSKLSVSIIASLYNMLLLVNPAKRLMPMSSPLYLTVLTHHQT
eukprot:8495246-Ditylum_brightwellii.AAC.1